MDPTRSFNGGSMNSVEIAEGLRFQEIHGLMGENETGPQSSSSFTALLGLPANQAMELLHEPEAAGHSQGTISSEIWRDQKPLDGFPFGCCFPTFPTNPDLVERAARFSVFAAEDSPQATSSGRSNSGVYLPKSVKPEPVDSDSNPNSSAGSKPPAPQRSPKRKEQEKNKAAKGCAKRAKSGAEDGAAAKLSEENGGGGGGEKEKLPYVHVRARRGQATDSHSLAERARREKINARMKLLQELVPGCNKISGTAQVLDEIINHVQSLQRQVEFLSMRLAAVNPRIDFSGIDSFLAASGRMQEAGVGGAPGLEQQTLLWPDAQRQQQQQIWLADLLPTPQSYSSSPPLWGRDDADHHGLVPPGNSLFGYESLNSVPLHANQLKQEI